MVSVIFEPIEREDLGDFDEIAVAFCDGFALRLWRHQQTPNDAYWLTVEKGGNLTGNFKGNYQAWELFDSIAKGHFEPMTWAEWREKREN